MNNAIRSRVKLKSIPAKNYTECVEEYALEYNKEISDKFINLVTNIIKYPKNIEFDVNNEYLSIRIESIKDIKKSSTKNSIEDDGLSIRITKKGFNIRKSYLNNSNHIDDTIFPLLQPLIMESIKEKNINNFNTIYSDFLSDSGILRDVNLELLNDKMLDI